MLDASNPLHTFLVFQRAIICSFVKAYPRRAICVLLTYLQNLNQFCLKTQHTNHCRGQQRCRLPSFPSRQWSEPPGQKMFLHTPQGRRAHSCSASPGRSLSGCTPAVGCVSAAHSMDACSASWAGWSPSTAKWDSQSFKYSLTNKNRVNTVLSCSTGQSRIYLSICFPTTNTELNTKLN